MIRNYLLMSLILAALAVTSGCQSVARQQQGYAPAPIDYGGGASTGSCPSCG